jgi:coenzyme F420-reducing hydrogenase gamma subunit
MVLIEIWRHQRVTKTVAVAHLNGCDRCAWHTLAINDWPGYKLVSHPLQKESIALDRIDNIDVLVFTGYAKEEDVSRIKVLSSKSKQIVAYGTCPYSGGIFGLQNQRGGSVVPLSRVASPDISVLGCPPSPDEMKQVIDAGPKANGEALCKSCSKSFEEGYFTDVPRFGTIEFSEKCFNNEGIPCSGVVSKKCTQRCVDFETPCRGCVESSTRASSSMLSFFGSMAYMIDVATTANWWTTDKLADDEDDLTRSLPDVVGTFFRFHLASAFPRGGKLAPTHDVYSDIMVGRPIEEAIQIAGTIYGSRSVSVALNLIDGYEKSIGHNPSDAVRELRGRLLDAQRLWLKVANSPDFSEYSKVVQDIIEIAGNEVLSNLFYGGFKTPIKGAKFAFDSYKRDGFEPTAVEASSEDGISKLKFTTDEMGIVREWSCEF